MPKKAGCRKGFFKVSGKCRKVRVTVEPLEMRVIQGYAIKRKHVTLKAGHRVLWKGEINDIGAGSHGDIANGSVVPGLGMKDFNMPKQIAKRYNIPIDLLIHGG